MAENIPLTEIEDEENFKYKCREIKFEISFEKNSKKKNFKTDFFILDSEIKCYLEFDAYYYECADDDDYDDDKELEVFDIILLPSLFFEKNVDFNSLFLIASFNQFMYMGRSFNFIGLKKYDDNSKKFSSGSTQKIKARTCTGLEIDFRLKIFYSLVQYKPELSWKNALKNEFTDNKFCDFTITLSDGEKIKVHKLVLNFASPVFEKAIQSDMLENKTNNINISNFEPTVVKEFIKYIYTRQCKISDHVHELFKIADFYEVEHLKRECEDHILNNIEISIENVGVMFKMAMSYDNDELLVQVQNFIRRNLEKCIKNDYFKKLLKDNPDWSIQLWEFISQFKIINDD